VTGLLYRGGLERWHDWLTAPHTWLLLDVGYVQDTDHDTIADVVADELTVFGYARQPMGAPVRAPIDVWYYGIGYGADRPWWIGLDPAIATAWLVLAYDGTDDASSGLLASWSFGPAMSGDYTFEFPAWQDPNGDDLPGGTAETGLVHIRSGQG
jgi:hypothetical protein